MTKLYKYFFSNVNLKIPIYAKVFKESCGCWVYIGQLSDTLDKANGIGVKVLDSGDIFQGYWKNGLLDGIGITILKNQDYYIGNFKDGIRQGKGTSITKNLSEMQIGYWDNGECENKKEKISLYGSENYKKASDLLLQEN